MDGWLRCDAERAMMEQGTIVLHFGGFWWILLDFF
jgi:hypothetical protein